MRLESHEPARFGRSSPVLKHWLAHGEGFRVEGSLGSGVVEKVYGVPGAARTLAVRRRLGRRRLLLPAEAFDEVVPADRLLIVGDVPREERRPRMAPARARQSGAAARRLSTRCIRALGRASGRAATAAGSILRDAALSLVELEQAARPHARRLAAAFARLLARAVARSSRAIAEQAAAARREAHVAQSLEKVIVALGRERAAENGRASEDRPRERTGAGRRRRRAQ